MKKVLQMAHGLTLAGSLYAAVVGMAVTLVGPANADAVVGYGVVCVTVTNPVGGPQDPQNNACINPNGYCSVPLYTPQGALFAFLAGTCVTNPATNNTAANCGCSPNDGAIPIPISPTSPS